MTRKKHSNGRSHVSVGRRASGTTLLLNELVEEYLGQYDVEPETIDKLCWLLAKAVRTFGGRRLRISPQPRSDAALITRTRGWATLQV